MEKEVAVPSDEESSQSDGTAAAPLTVAAAEAAAAEAAARARKARARATRLRRRAKATPAHRSDHSRSPTRRRRWRLPRFKALIAGVGVGLICASSAASGSIWWQHRVAAGERQRAAEFASAARQAAVVLLTLDYTKTKEHIQRVLDNSTGTFRSGFEKTATAVAERLEQSKVVADADVKGTAVQSMSDNAGVVLVAVQTEATEMGGPRQPTSWRVALSLTRDGGQLKISDVEFVE